MKKHSIEIEADLKAASLKNQMKKVSSEMANDFNKAFGTSVTGKDIFQALENQAKKALQEAKKQAKAVQKEIKEANKQAEILRKNVSKVEYDIDTGKTTAKINDLKNQFIKLGESEQEAENKIKNLKDSFYAITKETDGNKMTSMYEKLGKEIDKTSNFLKKMKSNASVMSKMATQTQLDNQIIKFNDQLRLNTRYSNSAKESVRKLMDELSRGNVSAKRLREIGIEGKKVHQEMAKVNKVGLSFKDILNKSAKNFTAWLTASGAIMGSIRVIKSMVEEVRVLDNSLVELSKVSNLSSKELKEVTSQAYNLAGEVARTGSEVIDATTEFKRAGYEIQESMDMAKDALIMTNVAEGITDTGEAAGVLISILKGFKMEASETTKIVDKMNEVANTSPINFDELTEGLQRTSGIMSQSGASIDESIGLLTAGFSQLRNIEKVSTGIISLSSRLRGVDDDGETIDGLSATLKKDFGKIGIEIEDNGELRSIYEIAQDYSKVLPTLTSKQKEFYAQLAGGRQQKAVWTAITEQFADAEKATAASLDSVGSAAKENEKVINSISGKVNSFKSSFQSLSTSIIDSELVKFFIDLGTAGISSIDSILSKFNNLNNEISSLGGLLGDGSSLFGTLGTILGGTLGAKNLG